VGMTKNTYWGSRENGTSIYYMESTIDGTVPFSAKVRNYGFGNFKSQSLEVGLGLGQYYKVMSFYHTHPGNTRLSPGDAFQKIVPCFAIGWDGIPRGPYNYAPDGSVLLDGVVTTPH